MFHDIAAQLSRSFTDEFTKLVSEDFPAYKSSASRGNLEHVLLLSHVHQFVLLQSFLVLL